LSSNRNIEKWFGKIGTRFVVLIRLDIRTKKFNKLIKEAQIGYGRRSVKYC